MAIASQSKKQMDGTLMHVMQPVGLAKIEFEYRGKSILV